MTKQQLLNRIEELKPQLLEFLDKKTNEVIQSGAINLDSYEDNYLLAKLILVCILNIFNQKNQPHNKILEDELKNLYKFI